MVPAGVWSSNKGSVPWASGSLAPKRYCPTHGAGADLQPVLAGVEAQKGVLEDLVAKPAVLAQRRHFHHGAGGGVLSGELLFHGRHGTATVAFLASRIWSAASGLSAEGGSGGIIRSVGRSAYGEPMIVRMVVAAVILVLGAWIGSVVRAEEPHRPGGAGPAVRVIPLPEQALVPDVVVGPEGTVHVVYGLGDQAWYMRSLDQGASFTAPVAVNATGKVQLTMGELSGPKIALGKAGAIQVVWADRWAPGVKVHARLARSVDGGKTFLPPVQLSSTPGLDGVTMAADAQGNVVAFWHTFGPPQNEVKRGAGST